MYSFFSLRLLVLREFTKHILHRFAGMIKAVCKRCKFHIHVRIVLGQLYQSRSVSQCQILSFCKVPSCHILRRVFKEHENFPHPIHSLQITENLLLEVDWTISGTSAEKSTNMAVHSDDQLPKSLSGFVLESYPKYQVCQRPEGKPEST